MITLPILTALRDALYGDVVNLETNYFAIGSGTTAVTGNETTLVTEVFRVPLSTIAKNGTVNLDTVSELLDTDGALTIREIGLFADATGTADSGTLISRVLYTRDKTSLESIQFNYNLALGR